MKKTFSTIAVVGLVVLTTLSGCKGNGKTNSESAKADQPASTTTEDTVSQQSVDEPALYDNYQNAKYGFSVLVPKQMKCTDEAPLAEGANYAIEGDEGFNMMSVIASDNYGGKAFTSDDIKGEMDSRAAELGEEPGTKVTKKEASDGWTITVEGGELYHQVYLAKYKAGRRYELTYIYDEGHAQTLGNTVEADVIKSMTVK